MTININDINIKIKLLSSDTILAQATVILFDEWEEHGWKVLKSNKIHQTYNEEVWIQAPSFKNGAVWKEIIFINNSQLFIEVQNKIYDAFKYARDKKEALSNQDNQESEINEKEVDKIYEALNP